MGASICTGISDWDVWS